MNIFRKFYLTLASVYAVSQLMGLPTFQQEGPSISNSHDQFFLSKRERSMSMDSPTPHTHHQIVKGHFYKKQEPRIPDADLLLQLEKTLKNCNPTHPPKEKPITVDNSVRILNTPTINPEEMTLKLLMEVRQSWSDQRFLLHLPRPIQLPDNYQGLIWNPNTIVLNANFIERQSVYMRKSRLTVDTSKGKITHVFYVSTKTGCLLDLTDYPYDQQQCTIQLGSEAYNVGSLEYRWSSLETDGIQDIGFSKEALASSSEFKYTGCSATNSSIQSSIVPEKFSELRITLHLSRRAMFPFYSFTLPFAMIVFLAFLPPFLGPEALVGRITFGATTFIGSLGLLYRRPIGPTVVLPYLSALDVYAGLSMLLTFGSLVESCVIGAIMSKIQSSGDQRKNKLPTTTRRSQERSRKEVNTTVHFCPPLSVRMGQAKVKVSAISTQEEKYIQGGEEVWRNQKNNALMETARRVDYVTKYAYAFVAVGLTLMIHLYYRTTEESIVDFKRVESL